MRGSSIIIGVALVASPSAAQPPKSSQTERSIEAGVIPVVPTLQFKQESSREAGTGAIFPVLPQVPSKKDDVGTRRSSPTRPDRVSGYILNKQLVERIAREYPPSGADIGQGWNSFLNRPSANICIDGAVERLAGTSLNASLSAVANSADYFDSISGSAGGSYGPFSGSGSYLNEKKFSSYDANVVMNAVVDMGGRFIKPTKGNGVRLSEDALRLLAQKDGIDRFLQACGDSFVTSIRDGGRMSAILTISKINQARKEEIQAQAAGGFGGFNASANLKKTVQAAAEANNLKVLFDQIGGVFGGIPTNVDEMVAKFTQYKVDGKFAPRPYVLFTQNYRSLANWPNGLENRVSPVDQEFFVLSYHNFSDLGTDYDRAIKEPLAFKNFLSGGSQAVSANRDIALNYARNLDLAVWKCIQSFDCSIDNLEKIDNEIQSMHQGADSYKEIQPLTQPKDVEPAPDRLKPSSFIDFVTLQRHPTTNNQTPPAPMGGADSKTDTVYLPNITVIYYGLLASLPLYQSDGQTGFAALAVNSQPPSDEEILREFRKWLVATRLRPIANGYCARSANHPLCLSGKELNFIVAGIDIAPEPLRPNPTTPPVAPPPAEPKPEIKPTPKERRDQQEWGPCKFRPMICY